MPRPQGAASHRLWTAHKINWVERGSLWTAHKINWVERGSLWTAHKINYLCVGGG